MPRLNNLDRVPREALVLTAGIGSRLRPLSRDCAKAAVPVAGIPLIRRILAWLAGFEVTDVVLNLHHRPETITRVVGDGSDLGMRVRYSWEDPILGSAGGPARALSHFSSDPLLIVNGDTLSDLDLPAMSEAHRRSGALVTMALIPNPDPAHYGGVDVNDRGWVQSFPRRGPANTGHHFIGVQLVARSVFDSVPTDRASETVTELYPVLIRREPGAVQAFVSDARFRDIGTPADYLETSLALARSERGSAPLIGRDVHIDPGARLHDTIVWDRVVIEAGCSLSRVVVADDVRIPAGTRLADCAIVTACEESVAPGEERRGDLIVAPLGATHGQADAGARMPS